MKINENFNMDGLKALIATADDTKGHHIMWVSTKGEVNLTLLPDDEIPAGWAKANEDVMQFRLETFVQGNGYVGKNAIMDNNWMSRLHKAIIDNWNESNVGYIESF